MNAGHRSIQQLRRRFDGIYDSHIIGGGFFESDEYYKQDRERYWRSLQFLCRLDVPVPTTMLEIGGGQIALLCKYLFGDHGTVADISNKYAAPLKKNNIELVTLNVMSPADDIFKRRFDLIIMLEVIEHVPVPAYVVFENLKPLLKPKGILFLSTPNLFRLRNLIRMIRGVEFLDRFMIPQAGQGLGHQLEYSADHLRWQFERAGMEVLMLEHDSMGRTGHSKGARFARRLLAPLEMRPIWRNGLVAAARRPSL